MGNVVISGVTYPIYGEHTTPDATLPEGLRSAKQYFKAASHASAWFDADGATQKNALVTTARTFDRQTWQGAETAPPQDLAHPRSGMTDRYGEAVDPDEIHLNIILGSYEYALDLINKANLQDDKSSGSNTKRLKAGSVEIERFKAEKGPRFTTRVNELVGEFLISATAAVVGLATGTCGEPLVDAESGEGGAERSAGFA